MKKIALAVAMTMVMAAPAFAATDATDPTAAQLHAQANVLDTQADVKADARAVAKDNAAISTHQAAKAQHQANHDANKAAGNDAAAAGDSVKAAGSHVAVKAKEVEKGVDQKIMQHDEKNHADAMMKKNDADVKAGASVDTDVAE